MGRPSDQKRSARRPGKRERARVKKPRRSAVTVIGAATVRELRAGRKHWQRRYAAFCQGPISRGTNPESAPLEGTADLQTPAGQPVSQFIHSDPNHLNNNQEK